MVIRYGTEAVLSNGVAQADALRVPLLATAFGLLLVALWINRSYPGLSLAFVGILFNAAVIVVNGGYMPIWEPSLRAAGFLPDEISTTIHTLLPSGLDASFLLHLGPLADVIPIPLPFIQNVALGRGRVPDGRPRVLPVRGHRSRAAGTVRRATRRPFGSAWPG